MANTRIPEQRNTMPPRSFNVVLREAFHKEPVVMWSMVIAGVGA